MNKNYTDQVITPSTPLQKQYADLLERVIVLEQTIGAADLLFALNNINNQQNLNLTPIIQQSDESLSTTLDSSITIDQKIVDAVNQALNDVETQLNLKADIAYVNNQNTIQNVKIDANKLTQDNYNSSNDTKQTDQDNKIATNSSAIAVLASGNLGDKAVYTGAGGTLIEGVETPLSLTEQINRITGLTFTTPNSFVFTNDGKYDLKISSSYDNNGSDKDVSLILKEDGNELGRETITLDESGTAYFIFEYDFKASSTYTIDYFATGGSNVVTASGVLVEFNIVSSATTSSDNIVDTSNSMPDAGINPKLNLASGAVQKDTSTGLTDIINRDEGLNLDFYKIPTTNPSDEGRLLLSMREDGDNGLQLIIRNYGTDGTTILDTYTPKSPISIVTKKYVDNKFDETILFDDAGNTEEVITLIEPFTNFREISWIQSSGKLFSVRLSDATNGLNNNFADKVAIVDFTTLSSGGIITKVVGIGRKVVAPVIVQGDEIWDSTETNGEDTITI